jgi:hypothetical protein
MTDLRFGNIGFVGDISQLGSENSVFAIYGRGQARATCRHVPQASASGGEFGSFTWGLS